MFFFFLFCFLEERMFIQLFLQQIEAPGGYSLKQHVGCISFLRTEE